MTSKSGGEAINEIFLDESVVVVSGGNSQENFLFKKKIEIISLKKKMSEGGGL